MPERKLAKKYFFSVEGETEQWYLDWLKDTINNMENATYKVVIERKIERDPCKMAKSVISTGKVEICHLIDYESNDSTHVQQFVAMLDRMNETKKLGKGIVYRLGYSNYTFDLWIALHKLDCFGSLSDRREYLSYINRAYGEHFQSMDEYKHERNFRACLGKLNINDVRNAVFRSEKIMKMNVQSGYAMQEYKGYRYYRENPSLTSAEAIKKIMIDCGVF